MTNLAYKIEDNFESNGEIPIQPKFEWAKVVLAAAIVMDIAFLAGISLKAEWLNLNALLITQFLMPATALLVARSWKSGFIISALTSLVHPIAMIGINLASIAIMNFTATSVHNIPMLGSTFLAKAALWVLVLSVALPSTLVAAALKFYIEKRRLKYV